MHDTLSGTRGQKERSVGGGLKRKRKSQPRRKRTHERKTVLGQWSLSDITKSDLADVRARYPGIGIRGISMLETGRRDENQGRRGAGNSAHAHRRLMAGARTDGPRKESRVRHQGAGFKKKDASTSGRKNNRTTMGHVRARVRKSKTNPNA